MSVTDIKDMAEFSSLLQAGKTEGKLVVIDFHATWCQPCKMIAPFVTRLSGKYRRVKFAKVDVDKAKDVARECQITSMPTFQFYKDGKKVAEMKGANEPQLESIIIAQTANQSEASSSATALPSGQIDLSDYVGRVQAEHQNLLKPDESFVESDEDGQLLITIPFTQGKFVKLHSLRIRVQDMAKAPKTVKVYANQQNLSFDDVESIKETQLLDLKPEDFQDATIKLKFVKFQNIQNVTFFVDGSQEDQETTVIQQLILIGSPVETTSMKDFGADH